MDCIRWLVRRGREPLGPTPPGTVSAGTVSAGTVSAGTVSGALRVGLLAVALLAAHVLATPVGAQLTTQPGPDGTPQFDRAIERRTYLRAGPDALLTYANVVYQEVRALPDGASPEQTKGSNLRKRLLDLRLMMDFNAFLYDPDGLEPLRDRVDAAYEAIGDYKDLFDQAKLTGEPIDPAEQARRAAAMNASLEWLRNDEQRQVFLTFIRQPEHELRDLSSKRQPRLWRLADVTPDGSKSSLSVVAQLSGNGLANLLHDGLAVDDILDPDQEARFHDVRKALRSILVLVDMFPTAADVVGEQREPLARLVDAYGDVNDASIAYRDALEAGHHEDDRQDDLVKTYQKARKLARDLVESGELSAYVARLTPLQLFDVDPFH
jgi:hypothetical protein